MRFQIEPLPEMAGPAWLSLVNDGLQDCPGFEPLIDLDYHRTWSGERAGLGLTLAAQRAEEGERELLGAVTLALGQRRGRLSHLVVRPNVRRHGIGTALIKAACERFRGRELHLAEAQDWDAPSYRALYVTLGFRPVRRYLLFRWDLSVPLPSLPLNREATVRPATLADLDRIADLYTRMYRPYWDWSRDGTWEETREEYRARFAQRLSEKGSDRTYLVAVCEGKLVGGITARIDRAYNRARGTALGSLNPGGVGVLPAYRRRGIGARLLAEALALLRERGMSQATVWTFSYLDRDAPAVALYRRSGALPVRRSLGWEKPLT